MPTLTNVVMFVYLLAFVIMLGYTGDYYTRYGFQSQVASTALTQTQQIDNATRGLVNATQNIATGGFIGVITGGLQIAWDAIVILFSIIIAPVTIIGGLDLPDILKLGLQGVIVAVGIILVASWVNGRNA